MTAGVGARGDKVTGAPQRLVVDEVDLEMYVGGQGRPLIVLHGFLDSPSWTEYHELLAQQYRVVAPAHPGFAGSSRPAWIETIDDLAYFYLDLMRVLGLRGACVLGHSFGGWIAAEMAVRCCHAIERLVLVDAVGLRTLPTPVGPPGGSIADWLVLEPTALRALAWHDAETDHTLKLPGDSGLTEDERVTMFRNRESASRYGWTPFFYSPRLKHWLHRITAPTLVIWGEHDGIVARAVGEAYAQGIPDARLEVIAGTAHLPHLERPQPFADLVKRFLG